ncbi:hypothetical protein GF367_04780 [Candidatus Woesearchaeota archaeon]|nr:hypothetical protein [Candidatus Woesearchaeota archaeon]
MYKRHRRFRGFKPFPGDAEQICTGILHDLWNGRYLETDLGNYPQFYARDFGMSLPALLQLGMRKQARTTLNYALAHYKKAGKATTHLSPRGKPINFPAVYSPDSTAYLLRSVRLIGDAKMLQQHKPFLQKIANDYARKALDKQGRVRQHKHFGGMRDHAVRNAACYDTVMAAVVQQECSLLGMQYPFAEIDYKQLLIDEYWTGSYFKDDVNNATLTADANIYPFWLGIINDKQRLQKAVKSIQAKGLDKPFPIKYVATSKEQGRNIWQNFFVKDWEADSVWPMSGLPYIDIVAQVDKKKARFHHQQHERLIEQHHTFIEVFDRNGKPYSSKFFTAGEGMIWCAQWLAQKEKLK